jgi:hypothetical protein
MPPDTHSPATTTKEQDLESAAKRQTQASSEGEAGLRYFGQRRINLLWETTQSVGAMMLMATACYALIRGQTLPSEFWLLLGVVVNSYYQRTNHTKVGGISDTDSR